MAEIYGSFSGIGSGNVRPYITWYVSSQDIVNNTSNVYAELHFQRVNTAYYGFNLSGSANANSNINGNDSNSSITFNLQGGTTDQVVRSRTVTVAHNSDGTKSCYVGFDGNTDISWGTFNFGQTVSLPTIPRQASISNSVNFVIGDSIPLIISNPGNLHLKALTYVNGSLIKTQTLGQTSSISLTFNSGEIDAMYAQVPSGTSVGATVRLQTFTNGGYGTQVGSNQDKAGTASVNQTTNKPTFTTYTVANVDKTINNTDKYSNVLVSSSTATLLGSSTKMIKSYSKIRASITSGNKMVPLNSATGIKYRFVAGGQQSEIAYSAGSTVEMDIDNADTPDNSVTAFDSRSLTTTVNNSLSLMAEYEAVILFGLDFQRDNGIDTPTKLVFNGRFWKKYFSSNTTSDPGSGVLNTATVHYRFKETTDAWGAQTWNSLSVSSDSSGNIEFEDYVDGDLGSSGFDASKSFDVEVRLYDKLTNYIIEGTLNIGTPVIDWTQQGVAFNAKYDPTEGGDVQIGGINIARMIIPVGGTIMWDTIVLPYGFLVRDGSAISRTDYSELFNTIVPLIGDFTLTIATPGVFTLNSHPFKTGDKIYMTTTGALPTGLSVNTIYYVIANDTNTFWLATSLVNAIAGTKIATTGSQSGIHSMRSCPHGLGNGSTTFNLPPGAGRKPIGVDNSQTEFKTLGVTGGSKTHTLTTAELAVHTHLQNSHTHSTWIENNASPGLQSAGGGWVTPGVGDDSVGSTTATNQNAGSGDAHNNLDPYFTTYFVIRYK